MSNNQFAIKVEGLGKRYAIPHQNVDSKRSQFYHHLKNYLPFLRNDEKDYFWALSDVSFDVKPGEILGILGRNGSGKSSLLKILSGVTQPTTGKATYCGNIGALLEVGTGFHPDLTGRENIVMSGALLGLKKQEILAKQESILDFSGIGEFADVPVKRYSSGMYVRLAYAVASMLRADILILDEVMAVGDAEFREKSQGNIQRIAEDEGRSVLFVSHNERAMLEFCHNGLILDAGRVVFWGKIDDAVRTYRKSLHHHEMPYQYNASGYVDLTNAPRLRGQSAHVLTSFSIHSDGEGNFISTGKSVVFRIGYVGATVPNPYFSIIIHNEFAECVATVNTTHNPDPMDIPENGIVECRLDDLRLGDGRYRIMVDYGNYGGSRQTSASLDCVPNAGSMDVSLDGYVGGIGADAYEGAVHRTHWTVTQT